MTILIVSCKNAESLRSNKLYDHNNNSIEVNGQSFDISQNSENKIVFDGTDNEIVMEYFNSFFNSKNSRDVMIIEGNGNQIKMTNMGIVDNSENSCDTIIIKGDMNYISMIGAFFIDNDQFSSEDYTIETSYDNRMFVNMGDTQNSDSTPIYNKLNSEWMYPNEIFNFYLKEAIAGSDKASFYLGELYLIGLGTPVSFKLAEYYFLAAAKNGNSDAQCSLGNLYEQNYSDIGFNSDKAIYWYEQAALKGNDFAKERLSYLKKKW